MLVSIIVPTYNYGKFIPDALDSIIAQTYSNWECIIVDDGSTDETREIVNNYVKKDERFKYVFQENKGLAGARNTGLTHCKGDYVQLLDSDDLLDKDKIRLQLEFMESNNCLISYCEIVRFPHDTDMYYLDYIGPIDDMFMRLNNLWYPYPIPVHSLLINRKIFMGHGNFDESLKADEDRLFFCKLAYKGIKFHYFPYVGGYYRQHNSMNKDIKHMMKNHIIYFKNLSKMVSEKYFLKKYGIEEKDLIESNITHIYFTQMKYNLNVGTLFETYNSIRTAKYKFNVKMIKSTGIFIYMPKIFTENKLIYILTRLFYSILFYFLMKPFRLHSK